MIALTDLIKILIIPNLNNVLIKYSLKKANFHISTKKILEMCYNDIYFKYNE